MSKSVSALEEQAELARLREHVRLIERISTIGTWEWQIPNNSVTWSAQLYQLAGIPVSTPIDFQSYTSLFHPDDLQPTLTAITDAVSKRTDYELEHRVVLGDGSLHFWYCRGHVQLDAAGMPVRLLGTVQDITRLRQAESEASQKRVAEFLSEASAELASSLDFEQTLSSVARLAVPAFADYCVVDLVTGSGLPERLVTHHFDPAKVAFVNDLRKKYPPDPDLPYGSAHVIRNGKTEFVPAIPEGLLEQAATSEEHLQLLRSLQLRSYIVVPLKARDRTLGAMTLVYAESGRRYEQDDVRLVEDLGRRAGQAIDNARLVHELNEQRRTIEEQAAEMEAQAEELQAQQTELEHALEAMSEQESRMRQILDSVGDMIFTKRFGSVITYANRAACEYYGMTLEQLRGITDVPFNEVDFTQQYLRDDLQVFQTKQSLEVMEEPNRASNGEVRYFHTVKSPVFDSEGEVVELVGVSRDVTDQALARRALEDANRAKSSFMAVMSHELRTPLNAILGYADLLLQDLPVAIPVQARASVERMRLSARHLLEIIEEILTYSRIEAGRETVNLETVDVNAIVVEVAAIAEPLAISKGVGFSHHGADSAGPIHLHTDARKLRQILLNLVGNSIKFTEHGRVDIEIEPDSEGVSLHVRDTGIGIAESDIERIFDPFWQVESEKSRRASGTGLGLTVARKLTELVGGSLSVTSHAGAGSTFTVTLPHPIKTPS